MLTRYLLVMDVSGNSGADRMWIHDSVDGAQDAVFDRLNGSGVVSLGDWRYIEGNPNNGPIVGDNYRVLYAEGWNAQNEFRRERYQIYELDIIDNGTGEGAFLIEQWNEDKSEQRWGSTRVELARDWVHNQAQGNLGEWRTTTRTNGRIEESVRGVGEFAAMSWRIIYLPSANDIYA